MTMTKDAELERMSYIVAAPSRDAYMKFSIRPPQTAWVCGNSTAT